MWGGKDEDTGLLKTLEIYDHNILYRPCTEGNVLAQLVSLSAMLSLFTAFIVYFDVLLSSTRSDFKTTS